MIPWPRVEFRQVANAHLASRSRLLEGPAVGEADDHGSVLPQSQCSITAPLVEACMHTHCEQHIIRTKTRSHVLCPAKHGYWLQGRPDIVRLSPCNSKI